MKRIISLAFIAFALLACNDESSPTQNSNPFSTNFSNLGLGIFTSDFLNHYDQSGLIGFVSFSHTMYDYDNQYGVYSGIEHSATAQFVNDSRNASKSINGNVVVNATAMTEISRGVYHLSPRDEEMDPFVAYFGNGINRFAIDSSSVFDKILDSASFVTPMQISNITTNQTISKSQDLVINWTGGKSGSLVQCVMLKDSVVRDPNAKQGTYQKTTGNSLTITSTQLNNLLAENGQYTLDLISYDPKYINIPGNRKICLIAIYRHKITVNIVN